MATARRSFTMIILLAAVVGCTPAAVAPVASPTASTTDVPSPSGAAMPTTASPVIGPTGSATASARPSATPGPTATARRDPTATVRPTETSRPTPTSRPQPTPTSRPQPTPTTRPQPTPTSRPTPTPPPSSPPSIVVTHGSRNGNDVALTYDMGGRVGDALAIVGWLVEQRVHATIFMTGETADSTRTTAGRDVLRIIDAHPGLLTLGNHSYSHSNLRDLTTADIRSELRRTETALGASCTQNPRPFFRPPFGAYDARVLAAVGSSGYGYTVTWDVDTIDWRPIRNDPPGPTADEIVAKVLANARGGSIVLNHLGGYETYAALPRVVAGLEARGFDLVTLDELLTR